MSGYTTLDPLPVNKATIQKWVNALRSGKYKQDQDYLETDKGFCCLGVACDIFIRPTLRDVSGSGILLGSSPRAQHYAPEWLKMVDDDFEKRAGHSLMILNDSGIGCLGNVLTRFTFAEIADLLEAVYIQEVLGPACLE